MIVVFTPTRDVIQAGTVVDITQMIKYDSNVVFAVTLGTYLPNLRNGAVEAALSRRMSHILFIDSDMRFPPDVAQRLKTHNKEIVGANCRQRTQNAWTAMKGGNFIGSGGRSGLERVDSLGMGVTMINLELFARIPPPWFDMPYDEQAGKHMGEDVAFCRKVREAGVPIWADHDLSQEVKHMGIVEFGV